MTTAPTTTLRSLSTSLLLLATLPACGFAGDASEGLFSAGSGETSGGSTSDPVTSSFTTTAGDGDGDETWPGDGDGSPGDGDGEPGPDCFFDCGAGEQVMIDGECYCKCPEETAWLAEACEPCPTVEAAGYDIDIAFVDFDGRFLVGDAPPPKSQYDDANIWLENLSTGDRVFLANTHDEVFDVRVTPGIYTIIYELETPGAVLPHNPRAPLGDIALFESRSGNIQIPVTRVSGDLSINGETPPASQYDDAVISFRHRLTGDEVAAGNTHDGSYEVALVPGEYDIIYRNETPGELAPHNDGAVISTANIQGAAAIYAIDIPSITISGAFLLNGAPAPASQYDDANMALASEYGGTVALGNTHDGQYLVPVIPGNYSIIYMHETGANVPQNQHHRFGGFLADSDTVQDIDIQMHTLTGLLTINGAMPPASQYDDGIVHLRGEDDDIVLLGNTHDGAYQVNLMPGTYDVHYGQETAGGTVPENKNARVWTGLVVDSDANVNIDVEAVTIFGSFTLDGQIPPASVYEDGRIYLRNMASDDSVLLGSTHEGMYSAVVVPGDYEVFYVQEAGGDVPGNQNAALDGVTIAGGMSIDVDVPVVVLSGQFTLLDNPAPNSASDGGQVYLRDLDGDSALLGDSFAGSYATRLVAGTYGIYYRAEGSMMMPENSNGRFACITVE